MKKEEEEVVIEYFERNWMILTIHVIGTITLCYLCYHYIMAVSPLGFVIGVPAAIVSFQTLWIVLNPYALIYKNRIEIKNSMYKSKIWYLIDMKKVGDLNKNGFRITYNDDDEELVKIGGIRSSQLQKFRDAFNHHVCKSLVERED